MNYFEQVYNQTILPKYGNSRDPQSDSQKFRNSSLPNIFESEIKRVDLTNLEVFSIDPPYCTDADDAFSIYSIDNKLFLTIHIADPTYYIDLKSDLWKDILDRCITHYPSNNHPIHMMPDDIVKKASLMILPNDKLDSDVRKAISISFEIDKDTLLPTNNIKLEFSNIKVRKSNSLSYLEASNLLITSDLLKIGCQISEKLKIERSKNTIGTKINNSKNLKNIFINGEIFLETPNENQILMQDMIAEFAILTNSFIGEFIKLKMNGFGIFRSCQSDIDINSNISGEDILNVIISKGINAEYSTEESIHDLVGIESYCHFTSPMRRVTDCICHFLIKANYANKRYPWSQEELDSISKNCQNIFKKEKSVQYDDIKYRFFQLVHKLLLELNNTIHISFKVNSYTGLFLNCVIKKVFINNNEYNTHISYCLRLKNLNNVNLDKIYTIQVFQVYHFNILIRENYRIRYFYTNLFI